MCENAKMLETLSTLIEELDVKNCACYDKLVRLTDKSSMFNLDSTVLADEDKPFGYADFSLADANICEHARVYSLCGVGVAPCPRIKLRAIFKFIKALTKQGKDVEALCVKHLQNDKDMDIETRELIKSVKELIQKLKRKDTAWDFHKQVINRLRKSLSIHGWYKKEKKN